MFCNISLIYKLSEMKREIKVLRSSIINAHLPGKTLSNFMEILLFVYMVL